MTANELRPDTALEVVAFLSEYNSPLESGEGWEHSFSSQFQMACGALVALGWATKTEWGAYARKDPKLPEHLPRWDDICVVVIGLADFYGLFELRPIRDLGGPLPPNIVPAHGLGPAYAAPEVYPLLQKLDLINEGVWKASAVPVIWRDRLTVWGFDVPADPRFCEAVERTLETMPDDVRSEISRLVTIDETEVDALVKNIEEARQMQGANGGSNAAPDSLATREGARRSLVFARERDFDWLFFRQWRFDECWLTLEQRARALEIFHDRLAMKVRSVVVERFYPGSLRQYR